MIYPVLVGYDNGNKPIWRWKCDCEICLTSITSCQAVMKANMKEVADKIIERFGKDKPQDTAIYAGLRR